MIFFRISVCSMLIAISTMPQLAQADCGNSVADLGEINSSAAGHYAMENAKEYPNSGWLNVLKYNVFMANNRAETIQARISLSNVNKKMQCRLKYVDLVHDQPVDWENLTTDSFENEVKKFHSIAAILTDNLTNPAAPLFVTFSSASHNLLSAVTITVPSDLNSAGFVPVMMEYPGYGASMGRPSRENFQNAAVGLVKYLSKKFPHRSIFILGHSIGGAVALETGATVPQLVAGVISHATFINMPEASKDSKKYFLSDFISPLLAKIGLPKENWDAEINLTRLAEHQVPVLLLHGRNDASVNYRHLELLSKQVDRLKESYGTAFDATVESFDSTHEDIYADENYGFYTQIWKSIFAFTNSRLSLQKTQVQ